MSETTENLPMPIPAPLTNAQRASLINLVRRAARSEILPLYRRLDDAAIDTKTGPEDLVTDADRKAEAMIARGLSRAFPGAKIVGEEAVSENPAVLDDIEKAEMAFTIDPVDGTGNFVRGLSVFGVIISVLRFGTPVFGLLYDPLLDDWIVADDISPAQFMRPRSAPRNLSVSKGGPIDQLSGYFTLSVTPEKDRAGIIAKIQSFASILTLRCSCHEFRMLAQGKVDFVFASRVTPWDHAAGVRICQSAGGHAAMLDGREYRADIRDGYLLCASDAATWGRIRDEFSFLLDSVNEETDV